MTKEQIEEAIEVFSNLEVVTFDFRKMPKEFRPTVVQFFKELKSKKGAAGKKGRHTGLPLQQVRQSKPDCQ